MAKVIFLHLSVILFTGGASASVHAGIPPPQSRPPGPHTPHGPPPGTRPPPGSRLQHTVYERPVRILLECILVIIIITRLCTEFRFIAWTRTAIKMCEKYRKLKIFEFRKRLKVQIYSVIFWFKGNYDVFLFFKLENILMKMNGQWSNLFELNPILPPPINVLSIYWSWERDGVLIYFHVICFKRTSTKIRTLWNKSKDLSSEITHFKT